MDRRQDFMIDIETQATTPNAVVMTIGIVPFGDGGVEVERGKLWGLEVETQRNRGRYSDPETMKWWSHQSEEAKSHIKNRDRMETDAALIGIQDYLLELVSKPGDIVVWGNGSSFDITILESIYRDYNLVVPWRFWNIRDFRTYKDFVFNGEGMERKGVHHSALEDAIYQAEIVVEGQKRMDEVLKMLGESK